MLSAKRDTGPMIESQKNGAIDYLTKPIEVDKLMYSIDKYIKAD